MLDDRKHAVSPMQMISAERMFACHDVIGYRFIVEVPTGDLHLETPLFKRIGDGDDAPLQKCCAQSELFVENEARP